MFEIKFLIINFLDYFLLAQQILGVFIGPFNINHYALFFLQVHYFFYNLGFVLLACNRPGLFIFLYNFFVDHIYVNFVFKYVFNLVVLTFRRVRIKGNLLTQSIFFTFNQNASLRGVIGELFFEIPYKFIIRLFLYLI